MLNVCNKIFLVCKMEACKYFYIVFDNAFRHEICYLLAAHNVPSIGRWHVSAIGAVLTKGVGPSTTLAWPGWKQPDIPVEVDTARLATSRTDTVKELPGYPVQNSPSGGFLIWGGTVSSEGVVYDTVWMGRPRRKPWTILRTPVCFLSYRRLSPQFQFSLSAATLVYLSQWF